MTIGQLADDAYNDYDKRLEEVGKQFYTELLIILAQFNEGGKLVISENDLARLEAAITKALRDTDYKKATDQYFKNFAKVAEINKKWYKAQKINIIDSMLRKPQITFAIETAQDALRQSGVREFLVKPVANVIRQDVLLGLTYKEAAERLRKMTIQAKITLPNGDVKVDPNYLQKHVRTVAFDALHQYDGAINSQVKEEFDLKYFYYQSSLIETSRPFCAHLVNLSQGTLTEKQLEAALNEYCPAGQPSQESETYEIHGEKHTKKKGSGMIPGTVMQNVTVNRGGYGCRHEIKWVSLPE